MLNRWRQINTADRRVLIILLLLAVVGSILTTMTRRPAQKGSDWFAVPSTYYNVATGFKALYLSLEQVGHRVRRLRRPLTADTLDAHRLLFMLHPRLAVDEAQQHALLRWVRGGGRLVLAPDRHLRDWFIMQRADEVDDTDDGPLAEAPPRRTARLGDELAYESDLTAGVGELVTRPHWRFDADNPLATDSPLADGELSPLWQDDDGRAALDIRLGAGRVIVLGDLHPLTNRGLSEADNALWAANLARLAGPGGTIAFDEFHLGFEQRDITPVAMVKLLAEGGRGWGMIHLLAAGLVAMLLAAVRFGRPLDIVHRRRRRHGEFVAAAGRLLDRSGAAPIAWQTLRDHYRARLARLVHAEPRGDDAQLAADVARRSGVDVGPALRGANVTSRNQLLSLTRLLHQAVEKLEHAGRANTPGIHARSDARTRPAGRPPRRDPR